MEGLLPARPPPVSGTEYTRKLIRYLDTNKARLAQPPYAYTPSSNQVGNVWQQTYTIATLGLDPNSSLLNPTLTTLFSLGLAGSPAGTPSRAEPSNARGSSKSQATPAQNIKPLTLRLPADRLLYLLLLFQSSQTRSIASSPNIGPTDVAVPAGAQVIANPSGTAESNGSEAREGDVQSVRSWTGSIRTVGGLFGGGGGSTGASIRTRQTSSSSWTSFFGSSSSAKPAPNSAEEIENRTRIIWAALSILPSLTIHCLPAGEGLLADLVAEGTYDALGGLEVKVPLNVFRGLWALELDGYDPRGVFIPVMPGLRSLTVKGVRDGEDWIEDLLTLTEEEPARKTGTLPTTGIEPDDPDTPPSKPRFPTLQFLSLTSAQLFASPPVNCLSLTHLDLSSNLLNAIPSTLSTLTHLQSLNLANNTIKSVRGAHLVIPHLTALNLRNNRIDCLIGLEGILTLQRIDVRKNRLTEIEEVGRLAVLPHVREIYVGAGNAFRQESEEEWRGRLFLAFAEEGRGIVAGGQMEGKDWPLVDGSQASWSEKRFVQGEMAKRGRARALRREHGQDPHHARHGHLSGLPPQTPRASIQDPFCSSGEGSEATIAAWNEPSRAMSPNPTTEQAKRRRQRIVELDGASSAGQSVLMGLGTTTSDVEDASDLLPETMDSLTDALQTSGTISAAPSGSRITQKSSHTRSRTEHGGSVQDLPRAQARRTRVAASTAEDDSAGAAASGPSPEDMRAKMAALKEEVGDSWLKVLASQSRVGESGSTGRQTVQREPSADGGVVKLVSKKGKKKRAVGKIV